MRRMLYPLLLLVLLAALVGCAPEPEVQIVRETVIVPATVIVTRDVTAEPLPTYTLLPTYTPLPSATPLPTMTPTATIVLTPTTDPMVAILAYDDSVNDLSVVAMKALGAIMDLLKTATVATDAWRAEVDGQAALVRASYEVLAAIEPPPEAAAIHVQALDALNDFVLAANAVQEGLDTRDQATLDMFAVYMGSGLDKLAPVLDDLNTLTGE